MLAQSVLKRLGLVFAVSLALALLVAGISWTTWHPASIAANGSASAHASAHHDHGRPSPAEGAHQSHQASAASGDFVVAERTVVHSARMTYYHVYPKDDAGNSYAQTIEAVAASEKDFRQVQVYFYPGRAAYEGDAQEAIGILSPDGGFYVSGYGNDVRVEGQVPVNTRNGKGIESA